LKGRNKGFIIAIVICISLSLTAISVCANPARRGKGDRRSRFGMESIFKKGGWRDKSKWWDKGEWGEQEDSEEDSITNEEEILDEEIPRDSEGTQKDVTTEDTQMGDTQIEDSTTEDVTDEGQSAIGSTDAPTASGDIGYSRVVESASSAVSSAKVCSSVSQLESAINSASAGTVIYMKAGAYSNAELYIDAKGSASNYITIKNYPGDKVEFTNSTVTFASSAKYVKFEGFILKDYTPNDDWGSCVSFEGGASYIDFKNNEISNIKCRGTGEVGVNAIVLTGDSSSSINNVTIENCYVYNCKTGWSEAITTDGNVENCVIKNCTVDNTGNIGIDLCGNFSWTGTVGSDTNQSRNILVTKNKVMNCNSDYATSAGIYCDGGRDNTISYNIVYNSQCGIELGAEEKGADVKNFEVFGNTVVNCGRAIGAGAYLSTGAKHYNTNVYDNTIICNKANKWGENCAIFLERTTGFNFKNNIVYLKSSSTSFIETSGSADYTLSGNTWYVEGGSGSKPSQDTTGVFKNPNIENLDNMLNGIF